MITPEPISIVSARAAFMIDKLALYSSEHAQRVFYCVSEIKAKEIAKRINMMDSGIFRAKKKKNDMITRHAAAEAS